MTEPDAAKLVGLLADPDRLAVVSALALGATDIGGVAAATGLSQTAVALAARRLGRGGLIRRDGAALQLRAELFAAAARAAGEHRPRPVPLSADPAVDAVLQAFVVEGRLASIPAHRGKRLVVLDHMVAVFEPGVRYPEREVNALLAVWHPDTAALRRYLVDEGLLSRADGEYWRSGGTVEV
ncbi:DUF2087 domain-containing protein [Klenkia sp. PcliD-1-E]|uniref:DUF2087 domain-containing protein n=1 Tax=Klenkia sp. PcliD-1-E TaxID=2954492 RepID=UPI002096CA9E|nr:DUF2087 domain-containing protein [Klenkia sp. PcliD-1-E]MCO7221407.1 DUF2087 domain-containing protein [Klenkia sp. PcliD-1-E]